MANPNADNLPLPPEKWRQITDALRLPPQQIRIVELILRNFCDKQIAAAMGLKVPTIRTYLTRIFHHMGVSDRIELVLRVCAMSHGISNIANDDIITDDISADD
jgi:DNA-binding NarL/FixJ family response regulator